MIALTLKIILYWQVRRIVVSGELTYYMFEYRRIFDEGATERNEILARLIAYTITASGKLSRKPLRVVTENPWWTIELDAPLIIAGGSCQNIDIELDSHDARRSEQLENHRVMITGELTIRKGAEGEARPVLKINTIEESWSLKPAGDSTASSNNGT
jgi:hypothetical protein